MSKTILKLTQDILSAMDSDEVNSIADTTEATQVAACILEVYEEIVSDYDLQRSKQLFQLENSGDVTKPNIMYVPADYHSIEWIRYNAKEVDTDPDLWVNVMYLDPKTFVEHTQQINSTLPEVDLVEVDTNIELPIYNNSAPMYWTTFDDKKIVFDRYNLALDTTLVAEKTNCYGSKSGSLILADGTLIDLPERMLTLLRNEAKSRAFDQWKDGTTPKIEQAATRSRVRLQRQRYVQRLTDQEKKELPNYGRK